MVKSVEVSKISLKYGSRKILDDVNLSFHSGKITALIGPNGAGKSSLFRVLSGLVRPETASIVVDGKKLNRTKDFRNYCGFMLETPDFYGYLSGKKNLDLFIHLTGSKQKSSELLKVVGLSAEAGKKVQHYSRGMKQRLGFAQTMTENPDFFVLDEPFNGLDPEVKEQMMNYVVSLKNQGKGLLISTHLLEEIESIADDFVLLHQGKVFWSGKMKDQAHSKQNVTMWFSKPLPELPPLKIGATVHSNKIQLTASIEETEEFLVTLYDKEIVPYRIVRSSLLHDKYMEIAR